MSNKYDFQPDKFQGEMIDSRAEEFDQELERLLKSSSRWLDNRHGEDADLLHVALRLKQEAPPPVQINPAFRAHLATDLSRRAHRLCIQSRSHKSPFLAGFGWRIAGGVAMATLVLVVATVALNLGGNQASSTLSNLTTPQTPFQSAVSATPFGSTAALTSSFGTVTQSSLATTAPIANFGPLPASDFSSGTANSNLDPKSSPTSTRIDPKPSNQTLLTTTPTQPLTNLIANTSLTYNLKTTLPALPDSGQVFRQTQGVVTEKALRAVSQGFGMDGNGAKISLRQPGAVQTTPSGSLSMAQSSLVLTGNDRMLQVSVNGSQLIFSLSTPSSASTSSGPFSDNDAIAAATNFVNGLGLQTAGTGWGALGATVDPPLANNNTGFRHVTLFPLEVKPSDGKANRRIVGAPTIQVTINAANQVAYLDCSIPVLLDEQGHLRLAPLEASTYPFINSNQLQQALTTAQVSLTPSTTQKLQQLGFYIQRPNAQPASVGLDKLDLAYTPVSDSLGRLYLLPIVVVHGTASLTDANSMAQTFDFEGYVVEVQGQYLQTHTTP